MKISTRSFGYLPDGREATLYMLDTDRLQVGLCDYGATIVFIRYPDKLNRARQVSLGFDRVESYLGNIGAMGAVCGRYANRIAKGKFSIGDKDYTLFCNNGHNHLHGGKKGFHQRLWQGDILQDGVAFTLSSPDGDEGYPGNLSLKVSYTVVNDSLTLEYDACCDQDCHVNFTNHCYFNMDGIDHPSAMGNLLRVCASYYTPIDEECIPTGDIAPVEGAMDLRTLKALKQGLSAGHPQLRMGNGYDHNYVLDKKLGELSLAAELMGIDSGIHLRLYTTEPGLQCYSGNYMHASDRVDGRFFGFRSGIALETQHFPDSPHHPTFPSTLLKVGVPYHSATIWSFSVQ